MSEQPIMLECSWVAEREAVGRGRVEKEWKVALSDLQGNVIRSSNDFRLFKAALDKGLITIPHATG